ncbi:hypothetical protein JTE90_003578 [Oedothorax gibbosus]|uniref:Uncharacterized protein n=1 Tax=Oedothorax gibbosus TaxID=931172 RepID=A0AAV6VKI9_9ARAC|nr:hypothetical protein JTE90_003578 [Oedothorax gibbosus]
MVAHKDEEILKIVLERFGKLDLDISNCKGQSYDNAQICLACIPAFSIIMYRGYFIFWIAAVTFQFFQCLNPQMGYPTKKIVPQVTKPKTRWSARHDACRVVSENTEGISESLNEISTNCDEKPSTRNEAKCFEKKVELHGDNIHVNFMEYHFGKV